jgi:DNA (cytosine-5)-methyltransferase 1
MTATEPMTDVQLALTHRRDGDRVIRTITTPTRSSSSSRLVRRPTESLIGDWLRAYLEGTPAVAEQGPASSVRTVELFCGPGGLAMGFSEACRELGGRFDSEVAVDQDASAVSVYAANHRTKIRKTCSATEIVDYRVKGAGDTAQFRFSPEIERGLEHLVGQVDAVIAGPPCQGHSNLNNRSRRTDRRNELYFTVPAAAIALGADIVVIENVPAVVHDRSQVVASTRRLLLDHGYTVEEGVLSAASMGWAQTRRRFFMIGRRSVDPIPLAVVQQALADEARSVMWAIGDLVDCAFDERLHLEIALSEENLRRIDWLFDHDAFDLPNSERPDCHKDGTTYNAVYGRLHGDRPSPTITTGFLTPGRGRYIHPELRRTLTPWEAARLQGFPDSYDFFPDPRNLPNKLKLTKWIGDAVPMPLGYAAGLSALGNGWPR